MDLTNIKKEVLAFRDARDWKQFHNPKDLASAIAIEASELQEKFLWKSQKEIYDNKKIEEVIPNYYNTSLVINYLLKHINKNFSRLEDLQKLFSEYSDINIEKMWFSWNWKNNFMQ